MVPGSNPVKTWVPSYTYESVKDVILAGNLLDQMIGTSSVKERKEIRTEMKRDKLTRAVEVVCTVIDFV